LRRRLEKGNQTAHSRRRGAFIYSVASLIKKEPV
jgi:hypothetical protein